MSDEEILTLKNYIRNFQYSHYQTELLQKNPKEKSVAKIEGNDEIKDKITVKQRRNDGVKDKKIEKQGGNDEIKEKKIVKQGLFFSEALVFANDLLRGKSKI
jgi:hypothetical protein